MTITDTDGYGPDETRARLRDMAELLAKGMPDVKATVDEESITLADFGNRGWLVTTEEDSQVKPC